MGRVFQQDLWYLAAPWVHIASSVRQVQKQQLPPPLKSFLPSVNPSKEECFYPLSYQEPAHTALLSNRIFYLHVKQNSEPCSVTIIMSDHLRSTLN